MAAVAANAHLFGLGQEMRGAGGIAPESANVTVDGILYADDSHDSLAMLSVDSQAITAHVGSVLPTEETVTAILTDGVELSLGGGKRIIPLDIKTADPNQRIRFVALDSDAQPTGVPSDNSAHPGPVIMPVVVNATPTARATLVQPHFLPIGELRGPKASQHFNKVKPP